MNTNKKFKFYLIVKFKFNISMFEIDIQSN